ncbi:hypothetical protein [Schaalia hyovaginalis]|uniref:hypothetical protein n=2 Tax=Schaalia hyovaginalis TaxID=29316 RepID=UPI002A81AE77|nr:hypothetical protein [Schaalia hyovaginalis]MDY3666325.1 hypothetical protein [Schaalia hyovaginalis]MDY5601985.1 hypothetical protein [Schaalia hyovaginalis]
MFFMHDHFADQSLERARKHTPTGALTATRLTIDSHTFTLPLAHVNQIRSQLDAQLPADSTIRLKIDGIHTWLVNSHTITLTTN